MAGDDESDVHHEATDGWLPPGTAPAAPARAQGRDASGNPPADGDSLTLIKDPKVEGADQTLKRGTVIRSIRLTDDPEEIDYRHDAIDGLVLRTAFVRKR